MSERFRSQSDLLERINKYVVTSEVDSLTPSVCKFIDDEYNRELNKKITDEDRWMEEIEFHNLTTVHNIVKLWEILHAPTVVKRGRKSKKPSPINQGKLDTLKSSVKNIITGFEAPPNPEFSIGGYVIPDNITFEGTRLGRKPNSLKNYSFSDTYRAALREQRIFTITAIPETANTINENINTSNVDINVGINIVNMLDNDKCDNKCYYIDLLKKDDVIPTITTTTTITTEPCKNNVIGNSYSTKHVPEYIPEATAYIPPPKQMSKTMLKKLSKPDPIVERMDVFLARSRATSMKSVIYNVNSPIITSTIKTLSPAPSSILINNSVKLDNGTFVETIKENIKLHLESKSKPLSSNTTVLPCILPYIDVLPSSKPVKKVGRPVGAKNKTAEEKEQIRLNKKPKGRPRGSPNKKATKKKDKDVIIHDNEIPLRVNPNKFEVHMLQYTLENPQVSYAEWTTHSDKIMEKAKDVIKASSRQYIDEWKEMIMREINILKGKLSMGVFKNNGKGKSKIVYEPEDEAVKEAMNHKYELLETKKDDPFFTNLLRMSLNNSLSRKSRFDNIPSHDTLCNLDYLNCSSGSSNIHKFDNLMDSDNSISNNDYEKDLIDLSDVEPVNRLCVKNLSEKDENSEEDVINRLLSELHDSRDNNISTNKIDVYSESTMKMYLNIYQCVYSVYNIMK